MARSIKSKRGMALRRIKRIRYGKKELIRLNKMLGLPNKEEKPEEDVEMKTEEDDKKKGLSAKDYKLLKRIVHERSDTDDSDVDKVFDEVMVLTTSKFLRRKCQAKQHTENKRQLAISKAKAAAATEGETAVDETPEMKEENLKRKRDVTTLVDDYGSYPKWMNQKKIQAMAKVNRSMKLQRLKRLEHVKYRRPIKLKLLDSDDEEDEEEEDDNAPTKVDSDEGSEMETEEVTTTATVASPKAPVKKVKQEAKKTKKVEEKKETITEDSVKLSNAEDTVETIDLSD